MIISDHTKKRCYSSQIDLNVVISLVAESLQPYRKTLRHVGMYGKTTQK